MESHILSVHVVAGVVLEKEGKYLLVQEKKPPVTGQWNLPAGRVETGMSLEDTAIKEAKEETGYDVELAGELVVMHETADTPVKHAFAARIIGGELAIPEDEILDAQWFSLEEVEDMQDKLRSPWVLESVSKSASK